MISDLDDDFGITKEELLAIGAKKTKAKKEPKEKKAKLPKETKPSLFLPKGSFFVQRSKGATFAIVLPCYSDQTGTQPLSGATFGMLASFFKNAGLLLSDADIYFFYPQYISNALGEMNEAFRHDLSKTTSAELSADLASRKYKATLLLGKHVMKKLIPGSEALDEERGAPYEAPWGLTISSYHPKDCFMDFALSLVLEADISKFARLVKNGWVKKPVNIIHSPAFGDCCAFLDRMLTETRLVTCDIETTYTTLLLTCIGFSINKQSAFVIPWMDHGKPHWSIQEEMTLLRKLSLVLNKLRLLGQNAVHFDHYALALVYGINANFCEDTMLAHWECYPELPKSLGFINSFYTDNPYWKAMLKKSQMGGGPVMERTYNGFDNANTTECFDEILKEMRGPTYTENKRTPEVSEDHYRFNVRCARIFNYMSLHGAYLNVPLLETKLAKLQKEAAKLQEELNAAAGKEIMVTSPAKMKTYLYEELKLPVRYKSALNAEGDYEDKATQDYLTTLLLAREFPTIRQLGLIAKLRKTKKRISALASIHTRKSGIVGWGFNIVGTSTARLSSYKPADGAGVQAQNVDRNDRDLFSFNSVGRNNSYRQEDGSFTFPKDVESYPEDYEFWLKADLEGADSWTVGAQLYALGETTLIEDLKAGFKPAQILALAMLHGTHLIGASHDELRPLKKDLKTEEGAEMYAIAKAVNHGSAYMMAERTMHLNIFKQSKGEIFIDPERCKSMQGLLFRRYNYPKLHGVMKTAMLSRPYLDMPGGHRHYFLGRKDNSTLRQMLASTPQYNTTLTANIVLHRLYYDPLNRLPNGNLALRPANQVHDETDCAFLKRDLTQVREVWKAVRTVELEVMGVKFAIPFEATFGANWGHKIGDL